MKKENGQRSRRSAWKGAKDRIGSGSGSFELLIQFIKNANI